MTIEEALTILDRLLGQDMLTDVQELVFRHTWEDWTYERIAEQCGYTTDYVKNVGSRLWEHLSALFGVKVTKRNLQAVVRRWVQQQPEWRSPQPTPQPHQQYDLAEAPDLAGFTGREAELALLESWIMGRSLDNEPAVSPCRLVAVVGLGGIGKTALTATLVHRLAPQFDYVVWRSLRQMPSLEALLQGLIQFLTAGVIAEPQLAPTLDGQILQLVEQLRGHRCLIVLDNAESVLPWEPSDNPVDTPRSKDYRELLRGLCELPHASCVVLTSREKPEVVAWQEGTARPVRSLMLGGLTQTDGQRIFAAKGQFSASEAEWQQIIQHYAGNPLALNMVAAAVQDLFQGNISEFLRVLNTFVFDDIRDLLDRQFARLSPLEQDIMFWLALNREVTTFAELREEVLCPVARQKLPSTVRSLKHRCLLESRPTGFTQQPVVMEYVTERMIERMVAAVQTFHPGDRPTLDLFHSHPIQKATALEYLQDAQQRFIVAPIADRLLAGAGSVAKLQTQLGQILAAMRSPTPQPSYAAGNVIHLLQHLHVDLTGWDFSQLAIHQVALRGGPWHNVNLAQAHLHQVELTEAIGAVWAVAYSPDGQLLAAGDSTGEIHLWRADGSQKVQTLRGHHHWVCAIAFHPNSTLLASASVSHRIKVWDVTTGQCLHTLIGHTDWALAIAFSPDGSLLASSGADRHIRLWQPTTGQCVHQLAGHQDWVGALAFHPQGNILASGSDDHTIKLWDLTTQQCLQTLTGHTDPVRAIAFSPDGSELLSGSSDRTLKRWHWPTGECLQTLNGHLAPVRTVAYLPDQTNTRSDDQSGDRPWAILSGSEDQTLALWDGATGQRRRRWQPHTGPVRAIAVNPVTGHFASGSADQTVKLWDGATGHCLRTLRGYTDFVLAIACPPLPARDLAEPIVASGGSNHRIHIWEPQTGFCRQTLHGHTHDIWALAFSPQGDRLASAGVDQTIRLWDWQTGQCQHVLRGHTDWIHALATQPGGNRLASCSSDRTIRLWAWDTGQCHQIWRGHDSHIWAVAFSPNGQWLASGGDDRLVTLWDATTGRIAQTLTGHQGRVQAVAFSPDGQWLASSGSDRIIALWDIVTGRCVRTLPCAADPPKQIAFHPTQPHILASYANTTLQLWDITTGACMQTFTGHTGRVWAIAFSPDGQQLFSGGEDRTVRLWHPTTGQSQRTLQRPRPYEAMNITAVVGLTPAQTATLKTLGAWENLTPPP